MQRIKKLHRWMVGKTVELVNDQFMNCTYILFTDGSIVCLEAEHQGFGLMGSVPYSMTLEEYQESQQPAKPSTVEEEDDSE